MSTTIHIAPYVRGPSTSAANEHETRSDGFNSPATNVLTSPQQPHPVKESTRAFAIEFLLLAAFVGTLAAWIARIGSSAMLTILAIDGLLAGGLLIGYLVRRAAAGNASTNQQSKSRSAPVQWAYLATNYRQLRAMGLPRSAQSLFTQGISSHLMLEAVEPASLSAGDVILVEAGQTILADGAILEGMAVIDEAMVTGQSAPVVCHESGLKEVMRESRVLSGMVFVEVTPRRGHPLDWIGSIGATESHKLEAQPMRRACH